MALLRLVRDGGRRLTLVPGAWTRRLRAAAGPFFVGASLAGLGACERPDPERAPDAVLRTELGLTERDVVHTVVLTGGTAEVAEPALDSLPVGAWLQFVTGDWLTHEVVFQLDSIGLPQRDFLESTDQGASPPLLHLDARFVVSFDGAPPGAYPYALVGNGSPGRGVVVVFDPEAR